ncbi:MAG TPA: hypothetical protein VFA85_08215 [Terriglobales bacterium]|nr:hypothetical protein [Terriglobales bacterium]
MRNGPAFPRFDRAQESQESYKAVSREQQIIDFAELGELIDSPVRQYSSGMYARLGFAVATEVDPDILLIDEILAVGDAPFQEKCLARIDEFRQKGKTIVYVSHDFCSERRLCDRALLIQDGNLTADGIQLTFEGFM